MVTINSRHTGNRAWTSILGGWGTKIGALPKKSGKWCLFSKTKRKVLFQRLLLNGGGWHLCEPNAWNWITRSDLTTILQNHVQGSCTYLAGLLILQFGIDSFYLAAYMQEKLMSLFLLFLQESCKNLGHCSTWDICFYGLCVVCHSNSPAMQKPNQRCFTFSTFSRLTTHTVVGVNL